MRFRKKLPEVDAIRWDGKNIADIQQFIRPEYIRDFGNPSKVGIPTQGAILSADIGDWIVRYDNGLLDVISKHQFSGSWEMICDD
jgi:hypothetical protein